MKRCNKCLIDKPIEDFPVRPGAKDGRRGACKRCVNAQKYAGITEEVRLEKNRRQVQRRLDNPKVRDERNQKNREHKARNRERIRAESAAYREANREKLREANRARYRKKREEILAYFRSRTEEKRAYDRDYTQRHKDRLSVTNAEWKKKNKERVKVHFATRRAAKQGAEGSHTLEDILIIFQAQEGRCLYCKACVSGGYHVDHRMPLARGGSNWPSNLQILCRSCNVRKWAKHPDDFEREIGFSR